MREGGKRTAGDHTLLIKRDSLRLEKESSRRPLNRQRAEETKTISEACETSSSSKET